MLKKITKKNNDKNFMKKLSGLVKIAKDWVAIISVALFAAPQMCYAAGTSYLKPLENIRTIMLAICTTVGVIALIYAGVTFARSFDKMSQGGDHDAINKLIAAAILIGMDVIVALIIA